MNYYDYIAHYGVPGMKKGKRRWTNPDGTLNEAGKRRYRDGLGEISRGVKKVQAERKLGLEEYTLGKGGGVFSTYLDGQTRRQYLDKTGRTVFETSQTGTVHTNRRNTISDVKFHNQLVKNAKKNINDASDKAKSKVDNLRRAVLNTISKVDHPAKSKARMVRDDVKGTIERGRFFVAAFLNAAKRKKKK